MAAPTFQSLKGMHDLLAPQSERWLDLVGEFRRQFSAAGHRHVQTPVLEELAVFARLGDGTDVVTKEMYEFEDRDGTRIALRPESTAGVARAFIQHHPIAPWKVWYASQHFRHENTQKGRYRQHHQLGAECFGVQDPDIDVELIVGLWDFYRSLGLRRIRLELNSIGDLASRGHYQGTLRSFLRTRRGDLDPEDQLKVEDHPMRVLDSKKPATRDALGGAPTLLDSMTPEAIAHFDAVRAGLAAAGIEPIINPRLVRGLDYYTHTVFEVVSDAIDAAQSTIGGGGRYDGLVEALGGPPTPAFGFGTGIERVLLACDAEDAFGSRDPGVEAFVVVFGGDASEARDLCLDLRRAGISADRAYGGRSAKAQMKQADRSGARWAVLIGDDERTSSTYTIRDLRGDGEQESVEQARVAEELRARR